MEEEKKGKKHKFLLYIILVRLLCCQYFRL
jgi:hypothetical protein